jgi:hypothetical protein
LIQWEEGEDKQGFKMIGEPHLHYKNHVSEEHFSEEHDSRTFLGAEQM